MQSVRVLLNVCLANGGALESAWPLVLGTLQHCAWLLALVPSASTNGMLQSASASVGDAASSASSAASAGASNNSVLTTAVMADMPVLIQLYNRLPEQTRYVMKDECTLY